ncbi:hypothetical protein LG047_15235 [Methylocystis sp. WRRC1]|uniref:hypothetical protein n=1 Tax=Methylocystis sp. WRRC1 TaxID=1732014 RepID=UPI001D13E06C|nr:hypothetical protein [Methylocystis sp. WRRC1]MCC3246654.1 hypothetical protein [Methylocystis sp. WRRC1]
MKRLTITIIALFATQALAQEAPDPALQLLNEANARVVDLARQVRAATKRAEDAEAKLKAAEKPAATEKK